MGKPRTEEQKAARREKDRAFRAAHAEQVKAQQRETSARWRAAHPEAHRERTRESAKKRRMRDPEGTRRRAQAWREKHKARMPEMSWRWALSKYGISGDDYERLLLLQNGVCEICRRSETAMLNGRVKRLSVDHCHSTGAVRGLLCQACNVMLGASGDSPERLRSAAVYLEKR